MADFGLETETIVAAADALRRGDRGPASALIHDELLDRLMIVGAPDVAGRRLADLVIEHRPTSIGVAVVSDDLTRSIDQAADAFSRMRAVLSETER